jgi:hypothetical protein
MSVTQEAEEDFVSSEGQSRDEKASFIIGRLRQSNRNLKRRLETEYQRGLDEGQRTLLQKANARALAVRLGYPRKIGDAFLQYRGQPPTEDTLREFATGELGLPPTQSVTAAGLEPASPGFELQPTDPPSSPQEMTEELEND